MSKVILHPKLVSKPVIFNQIICKEAITGGA